jgi:hypothetical protein
MNEKSFLSVKSLKLHPYIKKIIRIFAPNIIQYAVIFIPRAN